MTSNLVRPPLRQSDDSADVPSGDDAGFTVLEALVSFVLFAVISAASINAIVNATRTDTSSRNRVTAANLAQQDLASARSLRDSNYPTAPSTAYPKTVTVAGTKYTLTRVINSTCPATTDANNRAIAWKPTDATSMQVSATVTWNGSTQPVTIATEIAC